MKIVLLGDVGSAGGYHAGDEAMAEAVADELAVRTDLVVVALSGDQDDTAARYGWQTVPRVGFAGLLSDEDRDRRLDAVVSAAGGDAGALAWDDPAWAVVHAVADADGVVISGGGNLSSTWPEHVYERAALASLAAAFGKPHVVTGQTLGPHLTARHGELVGRIITSAALVGIREQPSYQLAQQLGMPVDRLVQVVDDAAYLDTAADQDPLPTEPYVAATFAPATGLASPEEYVESAAALLDALTESGLRVVLIPHHATRDEDGPTGDLAIHEAIARTATSSQIDVLEPVSARRAARLVSGAALVVSTRYHPVVFAVASGVPAIGIGVDAYTSTKIHGSLANYGLEALAFSVASLVRGELPEIARTVLSSGSEVREHLSTVDAVRRPERTAWWDAVLAALSGSPVPVVPYADVPAFAGGTWFPGATALREWSEVVSARFEAERLAGTEERSRTASLHERVDGLERERADLAAELALTRDEVDTLRIANEAAHALVSDPLRPLATWMEGLPTIQSLQSELDAVYSTRTFRMLERPRRVYGRLRPR
ncbi:polysaccharide pyruvyl transferase family protein [Cellulomonas sp. Marseille-Q8402]